MKRRHFIKSTTLAASSFIGGSSSLLCGQNGKTEEIGQDVKSKVVLAKRDDIFGPTNQVSSENVAKLLDTAIELFFEEKPDKAWKSLISPGDTVGLKVNCLAGKILSTHKEIVEALVERILKVGVKKNNIIIWDRHDRDLQRAGYTLYQGNQKVQCYGNNRVGFSPKVFEFGSIGSQLSNIIHQQCNVIINLPVLKDHGIVGISGAMKNFFGAINNPNKYHENVGDPFVADVNMLYDIRQKTRLTICDAMLAQYEGGPPFMSEWAWNMNSILISSDQVALDQTIWDIIEEKRKQNGLDSLEKVGRKPNYIATAADINHKLGTNQREKIALIYG